MSDIKDSTTSPWLPIDTAPKDGTAVLLFEPAYTRGNGQEVQGLGVIMAAWCGVRENFPGCKEEFAWYVPFSEQDELGGAYGVDSPTHWMPLPTPPVEEVSR